MKVYMCYGMLRIQEFSYCKSRSLCDKQHMHLMPKTLTSLGIACRHNTLLQKCAKINCPYTLIPKVL